MADKFGNVPRGMGNDPIFSRDEIIPLIKGLKPINGSESLELAAKLQSMKAEVEILRRFRRSVLLAYEKNLGEGPGPGVDFCLQMVLEISDEYEEAFGPGAGGNE